jgi:AmmeMemoRadiSam system protein A
VNRELNAHEKQALLAIARQAIVHGVQTGQEYIEPREEKTLNQRNGCFVTIKQDQQLRGCIGNFQSELPLFKEVAQMAQASASKDPRFYPLKEEDLTNFNLEISVLSPLRKVENIEEIEVGTHGIYIEKSFYRGVLLPQVATEHNWDRQTFLKQTCSSSKPVSRQGYPQMPGKLKMPRSTFSAPRSLAKTLQNKYLRQ